MKKKKKKTSLGAKVAPVIQQKVAPVLKKAEKKINIPNLLTMIRMWAIPLIVLTFFFKEASPDHKVLWAWIGVVLFAIAGITDYLDGYLARHWNQLSRFGRVLDPIADKLLVGSILIMLAWEHRLTGLMVIPAVIILCREILVSGLREFLAEIKVGCPVTRLAKWKTACQMVALPVLMVCEEAGMLNTFFTILGTVLFCLAAFLTIITGYDYWKSGRKYMDD